MLDELAELSRRQRAGEPLRLPRVTVHLRSGKALEGSVLDVASDAGASSVLLHAPGPQPRQPEWDVVHLAVAAIEALTVHDVPSLSRPPADAPAPPSRLEVKRHVAALEEALAAMLGGPVPITVAWEEAPESLRAIDDAVLALSAILTALAGEEDGRTALREKVRRIQLGSAPEPKAAVSEGVLLVLAAQAYPRRMTRDQLRQAIEAGL